MALFWREDVVDAVVECFDGVLDDPSVVREAAVNFVREALEGVEVAEDDEA